MINSDYLNNLNKAQKEAVLHLDGPLLIVAGAGSGEVREFTLGMKNYNYYPDSITVKAGQPVKISLDKTAQGCFRDFTIRDLGVRKYLQKTSDFVEFTPTKKGTYTFACSMGMGYGKLIVK